MAEVFCKGPDPAGCEFLVWLPQSADECGLAPDSKYGHEYDLST